MARKVGAVYKGSRTFAEQQPRPVYTPSRRVGRLIARDSFEILDRSILESPRWDEAGWWKPLSDGDPMLFYRRLHYAAHGSNGDASLLDNLRQARVTAGQDLTVATSHLDAITVGDSLYLGLFVHDKEIPDTDSSPHTVQEEQRALDRILGGSSNVPLASEGAPLYAINLLKFMETDRVGQLQKVCRDLSVGLLPYVKLEQVSISAMNAG